MSRLQPTAPGLAIHSCPRTRERSPWIGLVQVALAAFAGERLAPAQPCTPEWTSGLTIPDFDGTINASVVFDDGSGPALYAAGAFHMASGRPIDCIARWDGAAWQPLGIGIGGGDYPVVHAMAVFDDGAGSALFVAGAFSTAGGITARNVAKWDGHVWSRLPHDPAEPAYALVSFDDGNGASLYIGGDFEAVGGFPGQHIASWDGHDWSAVADGVGQKNDGSVRALAIHDDGSGPSLYVGGDFANAGEVPVNGIARWDGAQWHDVGGGIGYGACFQSFNGSLFAGNAWGVYRLDGQAWTPLGDFKGFKYFSSNSMGLGVFDDGSGPALYASGNFEYIDNLKTSGIAKWNGNQWTSLGTGLGGYGKYGAAATFTAFDDGSGPALFVGGEFMTAGGLEANAIARWDGLNWHSVSAPTGNGVARFVGEFRVFDDGSGPALYAGGDFRHAGGVASGDIARWTGSEWTSVAGGMSGDVNFWAVTCLEIFDDGSGPSLYAGGLFEYAGGKPARNVAQWTGQEWLTLGAGLGTAGGGSQVYDLVVFDDGSGADLYACGNFWYADGKLAKNVARWDGVAWHPLDNNAWGDQGSTSLFALASFDDGTGPALYVGGNFFMPGIKAQNIAKWNGAAWSPIGAIAGYQGFNAVYTLAEHDDGSGPALYAGGHFTTAGGVFAQQIARWNGHAWSGLSTGISGQADSTYVFAVAPLPGPDGPTVLYVGGQFTLAGGVPARGLATWDGQAWHAAHDVEGYVCAVARFDDGPSDSLYLGGRFQSVDSTISQNFARFGCPIPLDCYADFDDNGSLDLFDFLGFVNAFNGENPVADCDHDDAFTLFDFLCFTNAFNAGC